MLAWPQIDSYTDIIANQIGVVVLSRALSHTERQLRYSAEASWELRWRFIDDMNRDGVVTISDVWLWVKWIYFAPGDWALLVLMRYLTPVAAFFEITPGFLQGWISGLYSLMAWFLIFGVLGTFVNWNLRCEARG